MGVLTYMHGHSMFTFLSDIPYVDACEGWAGVSFSSFCIIPYTSLTSLFVFIYISDVTVVTSI